MNFAMTANVMY